MGGHIRYTERLAALRRDRSDRDGIAYQPVRDAEGDLTDLNREARFGILRCLQFDRQEDDEDLSRYLFIEEVNYCREMWGINREVDLAAFLLSRYRRASDLRLFWWAKRESFDLYCGLDWEYLFAAGVGDTPKAIKATTRDFDAEERKTLRRYIAERTPPTSEQMAQWWQRKQREYPAREEDEPPLRRYQAALALGEIEEARQWLDIMESELPVPLTDDDLSTLVWRRAEVQQFDMAYQAALHRMILCLGGDREEWELLSLRLSAGRYAILAGRYAEAFGHLILSAFVCDSKASYRKSGMACRIAEVLLDLASAVGQKEERVIARPAFDTASHLYAAGVIPSLVALKKALEVAQALLDEAAVAHYAKRVRAEEKRIRKM